MSIVEATATVTSIFSLSRWRPVLRWMSTREVRPMSWTRPTRRPR